MMLVYILPIIAALLNPVLAHEARTLRLSPKQMGRIIIAPGRTTILSFPMKPTKVILGNKGMFAVEYVENDLAIAALTSTSRSNLFVYLDSRRFGFDLSTSSQGAEEIVLVRDATENQMKVNVK